MIPRLFLNLVLVTILSFNLGAKEFFSGLFENSIATFTDAAKMLYHSFNIAEMSKNYKRQNFYRQKSSKKKENVSLQEIYQFLQEKGIDASLLSQPMAKKNFARLLFQRFKKLPKSFLTQNLEFEILYFRDAQNLGIFGGTELPKGTLTVKDMLNSFLKASHLASSYLAQ